MARNQWLWHLSRIDQTPGTKKKSEAAAVCHGAGEPETERLYGKNSEAWEILETRSPQVKLRLHRYVLTSPNFLKHITFEAKREQSHYLLTHILGIVEVFLLEDQHSCAVQKHALIWVGTPGSSHFPARLVFHFCFFKFFLSWDFNYIFWKGE